MSRMDDAQAAGGVIEGVEQGIVVQAGQGIDRIDVMAQEGFDGGFGSGETRHAVGL